MQAVHDSLRLLLFRDERGEYLLVLEQNAEKLREGPQHARLFFWIRMQVVVVYGEDAEDTVLYHKRELSRGRYLIFRQHPHPFPANPIVREEAFRQIRFLVEKGTGNE